ncbi:MAG: hypothetical protein ACRC8B_22850 [Aeromonas sobria]|uniref:hypothetical protein n=1 Tax=Aeromonas sobria TaxID=646 RepID=UPI003F37D959
MFRTGGVWFLALWEILGALKQIALFSGQQVQHTLDGTNRAWNQQQEARAKAKAEAQATIWIRTKAERDAMMAEYASKMAALHAKQEQDRAELMTKATAMAERQAQLKALWATSEPKSTKWEYKA